MKSVGRLILLQYRNSQNQMFKLSHCSSIRAPLPMLNGTVCKIIYNALNMSTAAWVSKSRSEAGQMPQRVPRVPQGHRTQRRRGGGAGDGQHSPPVTPATSRRRDRTRHSPGSSTVPGQETTLPCGKYFIKPCSPGRWLCPAKCPTAGTSRGSLRSPAGRAALL